MAADSGADTDVSICSAAGRASEPALPADL